jgi:hypothetical protein
MITMEKVAVLIKKEALKELMVTDRREPREKKKEKR